MEWLKDKKNAPIVAAIAGAVIVAVFCLWWFVLRAPAETPVTPDETAQQGAPAPGDAGAGVVAPAGPGTPGGPAATGVPAATSPGVPGTTASTPAAANGVQVASVKPMETWRGDPFQPIGYKPVKKGPQPKPHIWDFPYEKLPIRFKVDGGKGKKWEKPEIQQPSRRMAGLLLNDRVYAIIEANGSSQVVQPGDYTTDRLAMVERIESDRVVLKTVDEKPRYITVKMAGSPKVQTGSAEPGSPAPPMPRPGANRGGAMAPGLNSPPPP